MMKEYFMIKQISIIGAGGKMGSWFTNYFSKRNNAHLILYDINPHFQSNVDNSTISHNIDDCVGNADIVFLCVPVRNTPITVKRCASKMKSGAILAEISSVKYRSFKALKNISSAIRPLSIHPMFGPGADDIKNMNILLVPVQDEKTEISISNNLFPNALITVIPDPKIHDELIALVLGLTHYTNVIFGSILVKENFRLLKKVSGTTFGLQSLLCRGIFTDAPDLIAALLLENPSARKYIQKYVKETNKFAKLILEGNESKIKIHLQKIKTILEEQQNLELSYQQMYHLVKELNRQYRFN